MLDIINRIRNFDPRKLTPIQIIVGVAATLVGLWVVWLVIQALFQLIPIALGILAIYVAYRWLSSRSEDIPAEMTKSKNQRMVDEALANVKAAASGVFGSNDKAVDVEASNAASATVLEESALNNLQDEAPQAVEEAKFNLAVEKEITREFQRFQQQKQDELRKEQAALEQEQRKLSQNSSQAEIDAYGKKMQATARKLQEAEIEAQKRFAATRGKLLKALEPTLEAFAKDNGIGLLLDSNTGGVVYVAPSWDNTSQLLPRIN
jgi:Skp family chaperone for outer membrane proteins